MFNVSRIWIALLAVALLVAMYGLSETRVEAQNTASYTATWLTLDNRNSVTPQYMAPGGQVIGYGYVGSSLILHGFLYDSNGVMHDLTLPNTGGCLIKGGDISKAINSSGDVIGYCNFNGNNHGFVYNSTGMHDLIFSGYDSGGAIAINTVGQVLGSYYSNSTGAYGFYLYTPNASGGTMTDLTAAITAFGWQFVDILSDSINDLNDAGQVVGTAVNPSGQRHAFRYDSSANTITDLGTLGGSTSFASAINSSGDVAGGAYTTNDAAFHAFLYSHSTGQMQDLGVIGGGISSQATAINDAGQVAGIGYDSNGNSYAFLYDSQGIHQLTLGGTYSSLIRLTSTGVVIGTAYTTNNVRLDVFIYDSTGIHDVTLSTTSGQSTYSASNDTGQVAGEAQDSTGYSKAYVATGGATTELTLGGTSSIAYAINKSGQVVGYSNPTNNNAQYDAFIYSNGAITDLLVETSGSVYYAGISDGGKIVVKGDNIGGASGYFVLTPIPPPVTGEMTPTFSNLSSPTITYGTNTVTFSGTISGGSPAPSGSVAITFNEVLTQFAPIQSDGTFAATFDTYQLGASATPYPITYSYYGDSHYNSISGSGSLTVNKANPTVYATGETVTFDNNPHAASGAVYGVYNENLGTPTFTYNGSSNVPVNVGTYAVVASYGGSANYNAASNNTAQVIIQPASTASYQATQLTFSSFTSISTAYMTPAGQVIGTASTSSGNTDAFLYDNSSGMHDIALPNSTYCDFSGPADISKAINSAGNAIGQCQLTSGNTHGFVYNSTGVHDLTFSGTPYGSSVMALNTGGQVLGYSYTSAGATDYYLYTPNASGGTMTDLNVAITALGWSSIQITAFNDAAQVIGQAANPSGQQDAFRYDSSTNTITDLGTLGGSASWAYAINSSGDVAGYANLTGDATHHAFLYSHSTGQMQDLGVIPGGTNSQATLINDAGQVAGYGDDSSGNSYAFLYDSKGIHQLTLGGTGINTPGQGSSLTRLTSTGVVIGTAYTTNNVSQDVFIYDSNGIHDVNLFAGSGSTYSASNDAGQVAGYAPDSASQTKGYLATGGATTELTLGGTVSVTFAINKNGQVVGYSDTTNSASFDAFIYSNGALTDLNGHVNGEVAGDSIYIANGISDNGEILAQATIGGQSGWFVLRPYTISTSISPSSTVGGTRVLTTITLANHAPAKGARITLMSSNPAVASVPSAITIAAGKTSGAFSMPTSAVDNTTMVNISATYNGQTGTATVTVNPPALKQFLISGQRTVAGGCSTLNGQVTLTGIAPSDGATVTLMSTNPAVNVTNAVVPAGARAATFTLSTTAVTSTQTGTITASFGGVTQSQNVTVRPVHINGLTLSPNPASGGTTVTGTVTLECADQLHDTMVTLASSNGGAAKVGVKSLTIPAGSTTGTFNITTFHVKATTTAVISATANGSAYRTTLTVTP